MVEDGQGRDLATRLHSAAVHLVRAVREVDDEMGLSPARASAMSVLVFGGPRTVGRLAAAEGVRSPTMTLLVTRLEEEGLAVRRPSPDDARQVVVVATAKGRRLLERGRQRRVERLESIISGCSPRERDVLGRAVSLIEAALATSNDDEG